MVLSGAFLPAAAFALLFLEGLGHSDENVRILLRLTARIAFMFWLLVFVARPLQQLFDTETTRWLLRQRPAFGLALGAIMIVHLAIILYRLQVAEDFSLPFPRSVGGMAAYALLLGMIVTTFDAPKRAIGPRAWKVLHKTGLYWIGAAFVFTLLPQNADEFFEPDYIWFTVLTTLAVFVRLTAYFAKR